MVLGVIPARGGSKGLPRKNVLPLFGKPLLAWSVLAARSARTIDSFVVSTEDQEIAALARSLGAPVLDRPTELASDTTTTLAVLRHALEAFPAADAVVVLQPTSPVRDPDLVDRCVRRFFESGADSLATGFLCKYVEYGKPAARRQDVPGFFYDDGNVYVVKAGLVRGGDRYGARIERVHLDKEQNIDIDDSFDFWLAEKVMERRAARAAEAAR